MGWGVASRSFYMGCHETPSILQLRISHPTQPRDDAIQPRTKKCHYHGEQKTSIYRSLIPENASSRIDTYIHRFNIRLENNTITIHYTYFQVDQVVVFKWMFRVEGSARGRHKNLLDLVHVIGA